MSYTKGPWTVQCGRIGSYVMSGNTEVAALGRIEDARLIAAAPDLLEALEQIIEFNRGEASSKYGDANKAESWACVRVARAAIAKAKGGAE